MVDKNLEKAICSLWFWNTCNLKKGHGNQTWYKLVDLKQGYNNAKSEKPCLNSVHEKAHKVFVKSETMSIIYFEYVRKS